MSDPADQTPTIERRWPRWAKALLVISLALNLAVIGLVAGALLRGEVPRSTTNLAIEGFRDIAQAMPRKERAALRAALRERHSEIRKARQEMRQHNRDFFAALRAEPFSVEAVAAVLDARAQTWTALGAASRETLLERIDAMPTEHRLEFADRLEAALRKGQGRPKGPRSDDGNPGRDER